MVAARSLAAAYARIVGALRYPMAVGWLLCAAAAFHFLPPLSTGPGTALYGAALGSRNAAVEAQAAALHDFTFPVLAQISIVQHRAQGLSRRVQANTVERAAQLDSGGLAGLGRIAGAIPVTNTGGLFPGARQSGTTALTYLFFRPSLSMARQVALAREYAHRYLSGPGTGEVGITGPAPAERAQGLALSRALPIVELASVLLVIVIVGGAFRSVLAPVITLTAAGIAYVASQKILEQATLHLGIVVPRELDPVIVVLLLGIMTDYSVFYLSGFRDRLRAGQAPGPGCSVATQQVTPLVLTAGFTVAASVAVIQTAQLRLFSELGPGLTITVAVGVLVAVSFIPAVLAIAGRLAYWPSHPRPPEGTGTAAPSPGEEPGGGAAAGRRNRLAPIRGLHGVLARVTVRRPVAALVIVAGVGGLAAAAAPLRHAAVGANILSVLPAGSGPARAAAAAEAGFAPGILAPTELVLTGSRVTREPHHLARLQQLISAQPGVAGVLGPATKLTTAQLGAFLSRTGSAARYVIVLAHRPTSPAAIADLAALREHMPHLLARAQLARARPSFGGATALSGDMARASRDDLLRVGLLTLAVDLVILALFLRSLVAPVFLVMASALVVAASFGITTVVFARILPGAGLTFYVPFAAEVLLISFGADYNLFLVGRIWEVEEQLPPRGAIAYAGAEASSAINVAGLALAGSFAMLALVRLGSFHQLALAMVAGLLLDTFFVRSLLIPSILSLLGAHARWPSRRVRGVDQPHQPSAPVK